MVDDRKIILRANNLRYQIDDNLILYDINFYLYENSLLTIIGPNGSGKTSLVKIIISAVKGYTGGLWIDPEVKIGYIPQKIYFDKTLPLDVLSFLKLKKNYKKNIDGILTKTKINHLLHRQISKISGGELQKIMLTASLIDKPRLIIMDEPTQGLDISSQISFYKLIDEIRSEYNISIIMISHDLHVVMRKTDYVLCLNKHICCQGTPEDINNHPDFRSLFLSDDENQITLYSHHHNHNH